MQCRDILRRGISLRNGRFDISLRHKFILCDSSVHLVQPNHNICSKSIRTNRFKLILWSFQKKLDLPAVHANPKKFFGIVTYYSSIELLVMVVFPLCQFFSQMFSPAMFSNGFFEHASNLAGNIKSNQNFFNVQPYETLKELKCSSI